VLQGAGAQASHALASQQVFFLQAKIFESKPQLFFEPHPQPLSQVAAAAQGSHAAISAPQLGPHPLAQPLAHPAALPQGSQAAISAPQLGPHPAEAAHGSQPAVSAPQLGAQRFLHGEVKLQRSALIAFNNPSNGLLRHPHDGASTPQLGPQPPLAHPAALPQGLQAAISAPQLGPQPPLAHPAALPQGSQAAISAPQLGPQPAPQPAISEPHEGPAIEVSQQELAQPLLRPASIRFKRSNPKLWLVRPAPRIIDPTNILIFIES